MIRQEYLDFARLAQFGAGSLDLARVIVTAEDVKSVTEQVTQDIRKHRLVANAANSFLSPLGLLLAVVVSVLCVTLNISLGRPVGTGLNTALCFGITIPLICFSLSQCEKQDRRVFKLQQLQPIAGTDDCKDALKLIESGHAAVLAWRDLAIAERGQLYLFDVEVMRCLSHQAELAREDQHAPSDKAAREVQRKRELEEACRIVNGI